MMELEEFQEAKCRPLWPLAGGDCCPVPYCDSWMVYPTYNTFMAHWTGVHNQVSTTFQCGCGRRFRRQDRGQHHQKQCMHLVKKVESTNPDFKDPQDYLPFRLVKNEEERAEVRSLERLRAQKLRHRIAEAAMERTRVLTERVDMCDMVTRDQQAVLKVVGTEVSVSVDFKPNWLFRK